MSPTMTLLFDWKAISKTLGTNIKAKLHQKWVITKIILLPQNRPNAVHLNNIKSSPVRTCPCRSLWGEKGPGLLSSHQAGKSVVTQKVLELHIWSYVLSFIFHSLPLAT
jgi:hypothetical protein